MIGFGRALPVIRRQTAERSAPPGPAAREGAGRGRPAAREDADPRRQRRVRARQPSYRPDDDAGRARRGERRRACGSSFRGKSGVEHEIELRGPPAREDREAVPRSARQTCFSTWTRTVQRQTVGSADVNAYLKEITGQEFTSKDFRTWAGTVLAAQLLREFEAFDLGRRGEAEHRRGDRAGGEAAGQHAGGLPQVLHPPGGDRRLSGWIDAGDDRSARAEDLARRSIG